MVAPSSAIAPAFGPGASVGTTIVALVPHSRAARATAIPWLPLEKATTPRVRPSGGSRFSLVTAPRILNEPVGWRLSSLSQVFPRQRTTGELLTLSGSAAAASSMDASVTSCIGPGEDTTPLAIAFSQRGAGQRPDSAEAPIPRRRVMGAVADGS